MANFNFNKVILGGRLTETPELKATSGGTVYTDFSIAVNRPERKSGERFTDFINCVAWAKTAEFLTKYFQKGSSICVTGRMQTRSWTDQQGNKRYATDVVADEITFVDSKSESEAAAKAPEFTAENAPTFEDLTDDDDLPF